MATVNYLDYVVWLDDASQVTLLQTTFPNGIFVAPTTAAATYSAPIYTPTIGGAIPPAPRTQLPLLSVGCILATNVSSVTYAAGNTIDTSGNLRDQTIFYTPGNLAACLAAYPGGFLAWRGNFLAEGAQASAINPANLTARRGGTGFEVPSSATPTEGYQGSAYIASRSASRTPDGFGYHFCNESGVTPAIKLVARNESWERFYMCPRVYSSTGLLQDNFWWSENSSQAFSPMIALHLDATGKLKAYEVGTTTWPGTLIQTSNIALKLNTWYRIDILLGTKASTILGETFNLYINGAPGMTIAGGRAGSNQGLDANGSHLSSNLSMHGSGTYAKAEIDFDDWSNMNYPIPAVGQTPWTGSDWLLGSHWIGLKPTAFGTNHSSNWVGDWRSMASNPVNSEQNSVVNLNSLTLTSSSIVPIDIVTDFQDQQLGCSALSVYVATKTTTVVTNRLGIYKGVGATDQSNVIASISAAQWGNTFLDQTAGLVTLPLISPVDLQYDASATTAQKIAGVLGEAEFIGSWGSEIGGYIDFQTIHNSPYPKFSVNNGVAIALNDPGLMSPVAVNAGTYVGNGTGQTITTTIPIHWWWVRPIGSAFSPGHWFSSMAASAGSMSQIIAPQKGGTLFSSAADGTGKVEVAGSDQVVNSNGVTYQWVGFSDLGMRYCINGSFSRTTALATANQLITDPTFTPDGAFFKIDKVSGASTGFYFKGPGNTANFANLLETGLTASIAAMSTGLIVSKATLNLSTAATAYSLWRKNDGLSTGAVDIITYTGNGVGGNRDIAVTLGGRSPIFAIIASDSGSAYFRDPSHLTTHSAQITSSSDVTTAIVGGGPDKITVNSLLNTNAVVYEVFVLAGDALGNSWSANPPGPIFTVDTQPGTGGAFINPDTGGWWHSSDGFFSGADLIQAPRTPKHPRAWDKLAPFTSNNAGVLGGTPSVTATVNNHFIYAGDDYIQNTDFPPIRIFDGLSDRLMATVPSPVSGTPPNCIMTMFQNGTDIYISTLDTGSSASNFTGTVWQFDPLTLLFTKLGAQFTGGEVPYALAWHMDRLWCGTNKGNGTAGNVYFFRPGIDTVWTLDHALSGDTLGGVACMQSYLGKLYVGSDNASAAAKVIVRSADGTYAASKTGGFAGTYNGFLSMSVYNNNLLTGYWDNGPNALIYRFDGTSWVIAYTGALGTIRPFNTQFQWNQNLYFVGGGKSLGACLINTIDGITYLDLTPELSGGVALETTLAIVGRSGA